MRGPAGSGATGSPAVRLLAAGCIVVVGVAAVGIGVRDSGDSHTAASHPALPATPAPVPRHSVPGTPATAPASQRATPPPALAASVTPTPVGTAHPGRAGTAAPASSAVPAPAGSTHAGTAAAIPPGVLGTFSYATTGSETTNIPGTSRNYPSTTKITNTRHGCGVLSTWKPISEHVQSQLLCPDGTSIKIKAYKTTISFYGVSSGESFTCSGDSYVFRPGVAAGQVWRYQCKSADAAAKQVATVIGYDTLSVGGTMVRTLHVRVATTISGADSGTSTQEYWIATSKPVLVKELGKVAARQQNVRYQSSYSLTLDSLTPKA